ncbi:hypothetical protein GGR53DRAFT_467991 [Hypoxylon sp. FL1150]|nr:hypothetical protein GGR53DRAFT_467991 [Hypoxylon sp. FL1150]
MAELLGVAASAVAVVGVASGTTSMLKKLWDEVHNVPETITDLVHQLEILESCSHSTSPSLILDDPAIRLSTEHCRSCMKDLASTVEKLPECIDKQKEHQADLYQSESGS